MATDKEPKREYRLSALQIGQLPVPGLLHMVQDTVFRGESVKPWIDSVIRRFVWWHAGKSSD